ncbi:hypothetical protein KA005_45580, partial [bacterium]|nr:hypothetical protein [bacterium]
MVKEIAKQSILIYIAAIASVWGFVEAFTYFSSDALNSTVGAYWYIFYIAPLPISFIVALLRVNASREEAPPKSFQYKYIDPDSIYSLTQVGLSNETVRNEFNKLDNEKRSSIRNWLEVLP